MWNKNNLALQFNMQILFIHLILASVINLQDIKHLKSA